MLYNGQEQNEMTCQNNAKEIIEEIKLIDIEISKYTLMLEMTRMDIAKNDNVLKLLNIDLSSEMQKTTSEMNTLIQKKNNYFDKVRKKYNAIMNNNNNNNNNNNKNDSCYTKRIVNLKNDIIQLKRQIQSLLSDINLL